MEKMKDEIDLMEVWTSVKKRLSSLFSMFIISLIFLRKITVKNIFLLISLVVCGLLLSFILNYMNQGYYKSAMSLRSGYVNSELMKSSIDKLNNLCSAKKYVELSRVLEIDSVLSKSLRSISVEMNLTNSEVLELEKFQKKIEKEKDLDLSHLKILDQVVSFNSDNYKITITTFDPDNFDVWEAHLVAYLMNHSSVQRMINFDKEVSKLRDANIDDEMSKLNDLKKILIEKYTVSLDKRTEGSNNVIMSDDNSINPISVFHEIRDLYNEKMIIHRQLSLDTSFEIVDGFTNFYKTTDNNYSAIKFSVLGLVLGYLFLFLSQFNSYLNRMEKKLKTKSYLDLDTIN